MVTTGAKGCQGGGAERRRARPPPGAAPFACVGRALRLLFEHADRARAELRQRVLDGDRVVLHDGAAAAVRVEIDGLEVAGRAELRREDAAVNLAVAGAAAAAANDVAAAEHEDEPLEVVAAAQR